MPTPNTGTGTAGGFYFNLAGFIIQKEALESLLYLIRETEGIPAINKGSRHVNVIVCRIGPDLLPDMPVAVIAVESQKNSRGEYESKNSPVLPYLSQE